MAHSVNPRRPRSEEVTRDYRRGYLDGALNGPPPGPGASNGAGTGWCPFFLLGVTQTAIRLVPVLLAVVGGRRSQ